VTVLSERCKGCEWCVAYCPTGVLAMANAFNEKGHHYPIVVRGKESACVSCGYCEAVCPDFAIFVESSEEQEEV
jgi:2-oxoglutarate ferredoxin oxidoreductase subunit delta